MTKDYPTPFISHIFVFILHSPKTLIFLASELKSFTDCIKKLLSLRVFSRVNAVLTKEMKLEGRNECLFLYFLYNNPNNVEQ